MDKLTCQALCALVTEYIEGALSPSDSEQFEVHMRRCPPCDTYLVQIKRTIEVCGHVDLGVIEPEARAALLEAFQDWKTAR